MDNDVLILSIGKYISSYNLLCLFHGFKDVMKQPINLEHLNIIDKVLVSLDLTFVLSDFFYNNPDENCFGNDSNKIIYISRDINKALLSKYCDASFEGEFYVNHESTNKYSPIDATINNGDLLGYPLCCINHFIKTDTYDSNLFYVFSHKVTNYLNCNNYLNQFENIILHHIPCSFECTDSISLSKKMLPYYLKSYGKELQESIKLNMLSEKTYILFKSLNWIKLQGGKYSFGSYMRNDDTLFDKIKKLIIDFNFSINIIDGNHILLTNGKFKDISVKNIQVLIFPKVDMDI